MKRSFTMIGLALGMVAAAACSSSSDDAPDPGSTSGDMPVPEGGTTPEGDSSTAADTAAPVVDSGGDSAADAGADACAGLAYCEDFEGYDASTTAIAAGTTVGPWKSTLGGAATMTIDTVKPYGGKNALHIKVAKGDTGASGLLNMTKAAGIIPTNDLWGRAMVYYDKNATDGTDLPLGVHSWIFQGLGTSTASGNAMTLNLANHGDYYFLNYHGDSKSTAESSKSGGTPVANKWVCMQWRYNSSGTPAADDSTVMADGTLALEAKKPAQPWDLATPFTTIQFGFTHYQTLTNAIDMYIDDFALDKAMIPCPTP